MRFRKIDVLAATVFVVLNIVSYGFGFFYIMDHKNKPVVAKFHLIVILYGSLQSTIGFFTGYVLARCNADGSYNQLPQQDDDSPS